MHLLAFRLYYHFACTGVATVAFVGSKIEHSIPPGQRRGAVQNRFPFSPEQDFLPLESSLQTQVSFFNTSASGQTAEISVLGAHENAACTTCSSRDGSKEDANSPGLQAINADARILSNATGLPIYQCGAIGWAESNSRASEESQKTGKPFYQCDGATGWAEGTSRASVLAKELNISFVEAGGIPRGPNNLYRRWRYKDTHILLPQMSQTDIATLLETTQGALGRPSSKVEPAETKDEFKLRKKNSKTNEARQRW